MLPLGTGGVEDQNLFQIFLRLILVCEGHSDFWSQIISFLEVSAHGQQSATPCQCINYTLISVLRHAGWRGVAIKNLVIALFWLSLQI